MKRMFSLAIAALSFWAASPAFAASSGPLISKMSKGEVAIVPEAMVDGELMFKVVAVNRTMAPAKFGPGSIEVFASGKSIPLMSLAQLIAQVRSAAGETGRSVSYGNSGVGGPTVSSNMSGQPNLDNFAGGDTMSAEVSARGARKAHESPAVKKHIANLRSAILQDSMIAPGALKGGEVVTQPIRLSADGKHTLRVAIDFNGQRHEFTFAPPPAR